MQHERLLSLVVVCLSGCALERAGLGGPADGGDLHTFDAGPEDAPSDDGGLADATDDSGVIPTPEDAGRDAGRRPPLGPAPILLGSPTDLAAAGSYVLLAKTGITNATTSEIRGGHLGVSPAAALSMTGFALIPDSTTEFSTSVSVISPARVYASDYGTPTPSNLTLAVLGMQAAYTDGAGRADPDFVDLASGALAGLTLVPGLYKWNTGVGITSDVTISGGPDDVWIFQLASFLDVGTGVSVLLRGGAQARNIFWVVVGEVTIHVNAHFEGILLCQTGITLQTDASFHGRALAQTLVALDSNAITSP